MSGRAAIDQYLYLMDQAFDAQGVHPLLSNLQSLKDEDWLWVPPGGERTVVAIVEHIGACKYVWDSHAFGDGSMRFDVPGSVPFVADETPAAFIAWLREGHRRLRASVAALADDDELLQPRNAHWGEQRETRWMINVMIQHDLYHGGEINHLRALCQGDDR